MNVLAKTVVIEDMVIPKDVLSHIDSFMTRDALISMENKCTYCRFRNNIIEVMEKTGVNNMYYNSDEVCTCDVLVQDVLKINNVSKKDFLNVYNNLKMMGWEIRVWFDYETHWNDRPRKWYDRYTSNREVKKEPVYPLFKMRDIDYNDNVYQRKFRLSKTYRCLVNENKDITN